MNRLLKTVTWDDFPPNDLRAKYGPWTGTLIELLTDERIAPVDRVWCGTQPNMLEELHRDMLIITWANTNNEQSAIDKFLNYIHHEQYHFLRNRARANQYRDHSRVR